MSLRSFLLLFLLALSVAHAANPISIPIIKSSMTVRTRFIAQLPKEDEGENARIVCIVPFPRGTDLIVCTLKKLYRVKLDGSVSVFLNVERAIQPTGRRLNFDNRIHGGVRSIAFHPRFANNRLFYVAAVESRPGNPRDYKYISDTPDHNNADSVLLEFKLGRNPERVFENSYRNVFRVGMPEFDHPIKQIVFKGKYLYIAHGDGSVQSATAGGGQRNDALGKILRISPSKKKNGSPYSIPRSNPFVGRRSMKDEVWALGFRNPHNICFSRRGTLFAVDAGRDNIEEINIVLQGKNYGWSRREGTFVHRNNVAGVLVGIRKLPRDDAKNGFEYPVVQVGHEGEIGGNFIGQAIAGACPVENGSPMSGNYFYGDFPKTGKLYFSKLRAMARARTRGNPRRLSQARTFQASISFNGVRHETLGDIVRADSRYRLEERVDIRFGRGNRGELYWSSKTNGRIYQFTSSLPR